MSVIRLQITLNGISNCINSGELVTEAAKRLGNELVEQTPRDTGLARSNWFITLDKPSSATTKTIGERVRGNVKATNSKQTIWLSNNLSYILALDMGHSSQAPRGFSNRAIKNTIGFINEQLATRCVRRY